mmetsp:Transcript_69637/g.105170  ORF Transcript_69637/g.105170 Transcript_69637/m.105170 type:complete len:169 (-) Transcript_69637:6-512(-)
MSSSEVVRGARGRPIKPRHFEAATDSKRNKGGGSKRKPAKAGSREIGETAQESMKKGTVAKHCNVKRKPKHDPGSYARTRTKSWEVWEQRKICTSASCGFTENSLQQQHASRTRTVWQPGGGMQQPRQLANWVPPFDGPLQSASPTTCSRAPPALENGNAAQEPGIMG